MNINKKNSKYFYVVIKQQTKQEIKEGVEK